MGRSHLDSIRLFIFIPKLVLFQKLNWTRQGGDEKILKPLRLYLIFVFVFYYFYFYYIKTNIFHKKNYEFL